MPAVSSLIAGGAAVLGGVGGAMGKKASSQSWVAMNKASGMEKDATATMRDQFGQLKDMAALGPGASDVTNSVNSSRDLGSMLQRMQESGGMPGASDVNAANSAAQNLFQARNLGLQQAFQDQSMNANRQAALMGRSGNDPVLAAKLAQEQTRQQAMLGAEQGSLAQSLAMQMPGQRLGFASARNDLLGGLAQQAMSNRQAILSMGSGIQSSERNWRLQTGVQHSTSKTGGGIGGAISGGLAGLGAGMSAASGFASMGGGASMGAMTANPLSGFNAMAANQPAMMSQYGATGGYGGAMGMGGGFAGAAQGGQTVGLGFNAMGGFRPGA